MRAIGDYEEMEEERRLCYVAITRAKESLTISYAKQRMLYGRTNAALSSRFLKEIPEDIMVRKGNYIRRSEPSAGAFYPQQLQPRMRQEPSYKREVPLYSPAQKSTYLELNKGDMVQHTAFGRGMVLSVIKMGGDALLEIAFDDIGTKKLMAKAASAHMKRL